MGAPTQEDLQISSAKAERHLVHDAGAAELHASANLPQLRITIITPSFNQGRFIQETIDSVLNQNWTNLEYLIFDGGSTDQSVDIIKKYEAYLSYWQSTPDNGQSHAVNAAFERATGDLIGWQNSDDYYYPNAFHLAAEAARLHPEVDVFYGDKDYVDQEGRFLFKANAKDPHDFCNMIPWPCINTEVMFFRRRLLEQGFRLNENRRHYMDYEFFWDLLLAGKKFMHLTGIGAGFRQHPNAKTTMQGEVAQREAFEIYLKVWQSGKLDEKARSKLLRAMQNECRNDFSAERWELFRLHHRQLRGVASWSALTPTLRIQCSLMRLPVSMRQVLLAAFRFPQKILAALRRTFRQGKNLNSNR